MKKEDCCEIISKAVSVGYKILLLISIILFLAILFSPIMEKQFGIKSYYANVPLVDDLNAALISGLLIIIPIFFLLHRKIILEDQLMKNLLFSFGYSILILFILSSCAGPLLFGLTIHYFRNAIAAFLTCPILNFPELFSKIELFLKLILALNTIQMVTHVFYYFRKKMEFLSALGISLLFGIMLTGIYVILFAFAGELLFD